MLLTSTPLIAADLLALVSAILLAFLLVSIFWQMAGPNLASLLPLMSGAFLIINVMLGLYPGTGLNPII